MLSIENPPEPSCSCKISGLKDDARAGEEQLALQGVADLVETACLEDNQLPQFSIRDYVFTARSRNIGVNWPFPQSFLQLCLKHGVKDLLPPFEPPDLVRGQFHGQGVRSEHLRACVGGGKAVAETDSLDKEDAGLLDLQDSHIEHKPSELLDRSVLESLDQGDQKLCISSKPLGSSEEDGKEDIASLLTDHVKNNSNSAPADRLTSSLHKTNSLSEASIEFEASEPPDPPNKAVSLCGASDKKCRLIVKLGGGPESGRTEDLNLNSIALSEPMASKICPVCKTFSSSSNTTLNAHIDQCLAVVEPTCERSSNDMTKYRVKPRKKRLMVDIYATAAHCTLEDLDRRNGTNWANDSNSPIPNGEVRMESKRQRMSQVDVTDGADDERAVYVDSKGTKLRILSKFNDAMAPSMGDDFTQRNHLKDTKNGKKKHLALKCSKHLKVKPQGKSLCGLRQYKDEMKALDEEYHMDNPEKEKSLSQLLKGQDPVRTGGSGTLRQWVCSKRSCLSKKISDKDGPGCAGNQSLTEGNPLALGNHAKRNHILKFSRLSEDPTASLRSRRVEIPSNSTDNNERTSPRPPENSAGDLMEGASISDGRLMKFVKYPGRYVSSPRSKRMEIDKGTAQPSTNVPKNHSLSSKAKTSSASRKDILLRKQSLPMDSSKYSENRRNSTFKRSQKNRCAAEMSEYLMQMRRDVDEGYDQMHYSAEILRRRSVNQHNFHTNHSLNRLENMLESETEAVSNEFHENKLLESEQESEDASTSDQEDSMVSKGLHATAEHSSPYMLSAYSEDGGSFHQHYKSDDLGSASEEVAEKAVRGNTVSSGETQSSDGNAPMANDDVQSPCLEEDHVGHAYQPILQVLPATPGPFEDQDMNYVDEEGNQFLAAREVEAGSFTETGPMVIQRSAASFPCPGETGYEVQERSSVTSSGPHVIRNQQHQVEGDQSGSPVSANSAISPPPITTSNFNILGQQAPMVRPFEIQGKVSVSFSDSIGEATLVDAADLGTGSTLLSTLHAEAGEKEKANEENLKVTTSPGKGPTRFLDHQPCCCSRKESISRGTALSYQESQPSRRKGAAATTMVPPKGRQVTISNLNSRPEICTPSATCSGSRIDKMVIPTLDPGMGSISMRASSNAAMKLQSCSNFGLSSPSSQTLPSPSSTCSPILRLMGKDVMVMSKDEEPTGLQEAPLAPTNDQSNAKYLNLLGFSAGNGSNQDCHQSPDDSFIFGLDHPCYPPKNFNVGFSSVVSSLSVVPQTPTLRPPVSHWETCTTGFLGSTMQQGSKGRVNEQLQQKIVNRKLPSPISYNVDRSARHHQSLKPVSTSEAANPSREVIVIDDSPELGPSSGSIDANYSVGSRGNQLLPVDDSNLRTMKALSCFALPNAFSEELSGGPKPNFLMSCPGANASSSLKLGGNPVEGLGILSTSPSILPSPSLCFPNPTLYYSSLRQ